MKKIILAVLVLVLSISLTACAPSECDEGETRCSGGDAQRCEAGEWLTTQCTFCSEHCSVPENGDAVCAPTGMKICPHDGRCYGDDYSERCTCDGQDERDGKCAWCIEECSDGKCVPSRMVRCKDMITCVPDDRPDECPDSGKCNPPCKSCVEGCSPGYNYCYTESSNKLCPDGICVESIDLCPGDPLP